MTSIGCIPEGERIDTPRGPIKIEELRTGDTVLGYEGHEVVVEVKHEYAEDPKARFCRFTMESGASFAVSQRHKVAGIPAQCYHAGDPITDLHRIRSIKNYSGVTRSFDLITQDSGYCMAGVPVNSMIEEVNAATAAEVK